MNDYQRNRKSYRGRYNAVKRSLENLSALMSADPEGLKGVDISDMRDEVELITQSFHEFSAYWNTVHANDEPS